MDILDIINAGKSRVIVHDDPSMLRSSALKFLALYAPFRGRHIMAASPQAERVLGAAMILDPDLHAGRAGSVVILDVNLASGTLISRAASRLRDSGNSCPPTAIVLNALVHHPKDWAIPGLESLIVDSETDDTLRMSVARKASNGSDQCILISSWKT
ncbi:hypothetical protein AAIH32_12865 [Pseudarthrobacter oxydans]|uniref:hypothetical protein n=1 Tax=Pseudarthrobacter oxydans TaxID=1671 RepID=UPI003D2D487A